MKIKYEHYSFRAPNLCKITKANEIIEEYAALGFSLTLRQLYYQFVARDYIPNKVREYKTLSTLFTKARLAGLMDWTGIEDRTRTHKENPHWNGPQDIVRVCADQFRLDTRATQDAYVEVWIEKDALVGVIDKVCRDLDVGFFSCRGYVSASAMWKAGERIRARERENGQATHILHLGDHDPSGMQMTEDIERRLHLFGTTVSVNRIALNKDQIDTYNPPPNPAKMTDPRAKDYIAEYGDSSWELDALKPEVLTNLIQTEVGFLTDEDARDELLAEQQKGRKQLKHIANNWEKVIK